MKVTSTLIRVRIQCFMDCYTFLGMLEDFSVSNFFFGSPFFSSDLWVFIECLWTLYSNFIFGSPFFFFWFLTFHRMSSFLDVQGVQPDSATKARKFKYHWINIYVAVFILKISKRYKIRQNILYLIVHKLLRLETMSFDVTKN